MKSEEKILK